MAAFQRPPGFKFACKGVDLRSPADAMQPDKYVLLQNVRSASDTSLQTRPGYVSLFNTSDAHPVTDIGSYATLGTDGKPRFLARLSNDKVYLDSITTSVATLAASPYTGACMIPFRPSASPQAWMYITNGADYQKLSAPDSSNNVAAYKVGIAEPSAGIDGCSQVLAYSIFNALAVNWTKGGMAGPISDGDIGGSDTVHAAVIGDPVDATRISVQISIEYFASGMLVTLAGARSYPIEEVKQPCATTTIAAIYYYPGGSGKCMIVPAIDLSDTLGRGSLVTLAGTAVLVSSVISGPNGTCAFECTPTSGTYHAGDAIVGLLAIIVHGTATASEAITMPIVQSSIAAGVGTIDQPISTGFFRGYTQDDYIHCTLLLSNIAAITKVDLIFNVGKSPADYGYNILTYSVTGASLAQQVLAGELFEISFPISALGGELEYCNGFRVQVTTTDTCSLGVGGLWAGGGGSPDVGDTGIPYRYRAVPRSSATGAKGNPSPDMRSNVYTRRQKVTVRTSLLTFTDPQVDLLDVERYGGSLTSFRYLGTVAVVAGVPADFTDNYFDDSLTNALAMETDNFEPWPSIDVPFKVTAGGGNTITVVGTWVTVSGPTISDVTQRWLPGTLITLAGIGTVTLRSRPTKLSGTSYLFEIEECIGAPTVTEFSVLEPNIARQILPYLVGPDEYGTLFGMGDPLRPGTLYSSASFNLDSAPTENTNELSPPSEPLIGGAQLGAVTLIASTNRWWAIYPSFLVGTTGNYTTLRRDVGRALAAPLGICSDGQKIYFWAKDCIAATTGGGYEDLTSGTPGDAKLYQLFQHEGISGQDVTREGVTLYAPDYSRAESFRMAVVNKYLYADYQDSNGNPRTLVLDLRTGAWSSDVYHDSITVHYGVPQQSGSLTTAHAANPLAVMGDNNGKLWRQQDAHNDDTTTIPCLVSTFEWDGGDDRVQPIWGDGYLDCLPSASAGISATPKSLMAALSSGAVVVPQGVRTFAPISVGGSFTGKSLGLYISWTDDFTTHTLPTPTQTLPTQLYRWGLSVLPQPEIATDRASDWEGSLRG